MSLSQPIAFANAVRYGSKAAAPTLTALFSLIPLLVVGGLGPAIAGQPASDPPVAASPIANADEPVCAKALARARDTRGMAAEDAIAASVAMLRACDIR